MIEKVVRPVFVSVVQPLDWIPFRGPPPVITTQPLEFFGFEGEAADFVIVATGTGLTYEWQIDVGAGFVAMTGSTTTNGETGYDTASLTITSVDWAEDAGLVRCVVTNLFGSATSSVVNITLDIL